jgi:hypothetical protein
VEDFRHCDNAIRLSGSSSFPAKAVQGHCRDAGTSSGWSLRSGRRPPRIDWAIAAIDHPFAGRHSPETTHWQWVWFPMEAPSVCLEPTYACGAQIGHHERVNGLQGQCVRRGPWPPVRANGSPSSWGLASPRRGPWAILWRPFRGLRTTHDPSAQPVVRVGAGRDHARHMLGPPHGGLRSAVASDGLRDLVFGIDLSPPARRVFRHAPELEGCFRGFLRDVE